MIFLLTLFILILIDVFMHLDEDFYLAFKLNREMFEKLPAWKQQQLKKSARLFWRSESNFYYYNFPLILFFGPYSNAGAIHPHQLLSFLDFQSHSFWWIIDVMFFMWCYLLDNVLNLIFSKEKSFGFLSKQSRGKKITVVLLILFHLSVSTWKEQRKKNADATLELLSVIH